MLFLLLRIKSRRGLSSTKSRTHGQPSEEKQQKCEMMSYYDTYSKHTGSIKLVNVHMLAVVLLMDNQKNINFKNS